MNRDELESSYAAVVEAAGAYPLASWNTVRVTGADRATFLHNMCTNDIKGLKRGGGCEAFFSDVKGKILSHAFVLAGDDLISLVTVPDQAEPLIRHLDRYVIREDVQLVDESAKVEWLLLMGAKADAVLSRLGVDAAILSASWAHQVTELTGSRVMIVRCSLPSCGGYLLGCEGHDKQSLFTKLTTAGAVECTDTAWHAIRIESAWPLYGVDFGSANLPQEVGRDAQAICFRKGCYLGQETVARIDALGHVNKRLALIQFTGAAEPHVGSELQSNGQAVGQVSSSCWSPGRGTPLALAAVRRGANEIGTKLQCGEFEGEVIAPQSIARASRAEL